MANKLEQFRSDNLVLFPANQEVFTMLMQWCEKQGMRWNAGGLPTTIGALPKGIGIIYGGKLFEGSVKWLREEGYKVTELTKDDFEEEE